MMLTPRDDDNLVVRFAADAQPAPHFEGLPKALWAMTYELVQQQVPYRRIVYVLEVFLRSWENTDHGREWLQYFERQGLLVILEESVADASQS